MRIIEERIESAFFDSPIFSEYFGGLKLVVADIETTGLSPARCAVVLGGALACGKDCVDALNNNSVSLYGDSSQDADSETCLRTIQFFGDTVDDETVLLQRYTDFLSQFDVVITYNGNKFDLPFLTKRLKSRKLDDSKLDSIYSLDLYRVLKKYSYLPELLPNMRQKTVEIFMGESEDRTDEIDGAESVKLYYEYISSTGPRKGKILDRILLHNRDDIVRLGSMLKILRTLNLHEIMYHMGFPVAFAEMKLIVENISVTSRKLSVSGRVDGVIADYMCYEDCFELEIRSNHSGKKISGTADMFNGDEKRSHGNGTFNMEVICDNIDGFTIADVAALGVDSPQIRQLGGYESGYLILRDGKNVRYHEANLLIRSLLNKVLQ